MDYIIGSFNLYKLNLESNENVKKNYSRIAEIIDKENFDVIALQEITSKMALERLLMPELGTNEWDYAWQQPKPYSSYNEGYAYIWRKRRLKLVESASNPKILENYPILRPPYYARFTPEGLIGGSNFELRLINIHIAFGKPAGFYYIDTSENLRKFELNILAKDIYRRVSAKRYGNNLPAYTIALGDYNLCLAGPGPKIPEIISIEKNRDFLTVQREKTTVKTPKSVKQPLDDVGHPIDIMQESDTDFYSRNYDHFSYELTLLDKLELLDSRVDTLKNHYGNNLVEYRKEVSDHVPIKLVLSLIHKEQSLNKEKMYRDSSFYFGRDEYYD